VLIKYSKHLEQRLLLRKIDYDLPKRIFEQSNERYVDEETGHFIATMEIELYNRLKEVMVAYVVDTRYCKAFDNSSTQRGTKRK